MIDSLLVLGGMFIGVLGLVVLIISTATEDSDGLKESLVVLFLAAICLGAECYVASNLSKQPWIRSDPYVTHTVMALQDGNEINGRVRGSRYSISGYINEEFMYVYGYKTVGGGMKIQKVSEKNATVYFDDNVTPNAKWYRETKKFWWSEAERYTCDIFIPTDSLQAELVIDLQ